MNKSKTSNKGRFFSLSAPSGTGKTTLLFRLLREFSNLACSVSCTTRPPRAGEKEGVDYYFISQQEFDRMVHADEFFEWEKVHGHCYGTPKAPLLKRREAGLDTILDIDTQGSFSIKNAYPDSILIFLLPPSLEALEQRLRRRQTESEEVVRRRLEAARMEIAQKDKFDYVVVNDDIDQAYCDLKSIILKFR